MTLEEELDELFSNHNYYNWDGYHAAPVLRETVARALILAKRIAETLPDVPRPEFAVCPDGSVDLDWYISDDGLINWCIDPDSQVDDVFVFRNCEVKSHGKGTTTELIKFLKQLYVDDSSRVD